MHKRRRMILQPLHSQPVNEPQGGGQGQQLPAGVQPGSAAAQALAAQNGNGNGGGDGASSGNKADDKPAGHVPVAELAQERQKRHQLETQLQQTNAALEQLKTGLSQALGVKSEQVTPESLQQQAQQVQAQQQQAMTQLAVYQLAATADADPVQLMDSASFLNSIKDLQPTDHAGITAAIKTAVERNKSLSAKKVTPAGSGDAGQGAGGGNHKPTISEAIRAAAGYGGR